MKIDKWLDKLNEVIFFKCTKNALRYFHENEFRFESNNIFVNLTSKDITKIQSQLCIFPKCRCTNCPCDKYIKCKINFLIDKNAILSACLNAYRYKL